MHELTVQTPTYLFAAVNLLLLAYFNRFHALSTRIRDLAAKDRMSQVRMMRKRLGYARYMILSGIAGVLVGMCDVFVIAHGNQAFGWTLFSVASGAVMASLVFAALEISLGTKALDEELAIHVARLSKNDL